MTPPVRAGVVVTGTEVLSGIIADTNGPWLAGRLRELGVDLAHTMVVGDRPGDVRAALDFLAAQGMALVITSGGLGPTADDLTAEVVAGFSGRPLELDPALEERILAILRRNRARTQPASPAGTGWAQYGEEAMRAGNRKQALVPDGATILEPVGTAPGLVVPSADGGPTVLVLPGPPSELQPMWTAALATPALRGALVGAAPLEQRMLRLYGIPEAEIARSLRELEAGGLELDRLEITTCLRRGEIEIATVFSPAAAEDYDAFAAAIAARHADTLFSPDGRTIDALVAEGLVRAGRTVAVAESCTGGLMAGRLTALAGSSAYVAGGVVVYSDAAKTAFADVPAALIARTGAVSPEVAAALADGARARFGADVGIGITGIAGPGGGTEAKPVGTVCVSVAAGDGRGDRAVQLPGDRAQVRDRTTTVALHALHALLA